MKFLYEWLDDTLLNITDVETSTGKVQQVKTENDVFYLKEKSSIEIVQREIQLYNKLKECNVPVSVPMMTKRHEYFLRDNEKLYCLYKSLPGAPIQDRFTKENGRLLGEAISELHKGLLLCGVNELQIAPMNLIKQLKDWAIPQAVMFNEEVEEVVNFLGASFPSLERLQSQIIHRDCHPDNIIFDGNQLSGFIDFDLLTVGPRLFDLCYCSTAILMSKFDNDEKRNQWFGALTGLIKGYTNQTPLSEIEMRSIVPMQLAIDLIFIAYFAEQGLSDIARLNVDGLFWIYRNSALIGL